MKRIAAAILVFAVGCADDSPDPSEVLRKQSWKSTVETVDGVPIGEKQVELEVNSGKSREEALATLKQRKRVLADALDSPPRTADYLRRQSVVQAYIEGEMPVDENVRERLKESDIATTKAEIEAALSKPKGFVATLVTLTADSAPGTQDLVERAERMASSLGNDPSDDAVQALESNEGPVRVDVQYGIPFGSVAESRVRPGWASVSGDGAAKVESLAEGDRVTDAYALGENQAQFMVKLQDIPAVEPDPEEVERRIRKHIEELSRSIHVQRKAESLVETQPWTFYPDVIEEEGEF